MSWLLDYIPPYKRDLPPSVKHGTEANIQRHLELSNLWNLWKSLLHEILVQIHFKAIRQINGQKMLNANFYHLWLRNLLSHVPWEAGRIWWSYIASTIAHSQRQYWARQTSALIYSNIKFLCWSCTFKESSNSLNSNPLLTLLLIKKGMC